MQADLALMKIRVACWCLCFGGAIWALLIGCYMLALVNVGPALWLLCVGVVKSCRCVLIVIC